MEEWKVCRRQSRASRLHPSASDSYCRQHRQAPLGQASCRRSLPSLTRDTACQRPASYSAKQARRRQPQTDSLHRRVSAATVLSEQTRRPGQVQMQSACLAKPPCTRQACACRVQRSKLLCRPTQLNQARHSQPHAKTACTAEYSASSMLSKPSLRPGQVQMQSACLASQSGPPPVPRTAKRWKPPSLSRQVAIFNR